MPEYISLEEYKAYARIETPEEASSAHDEDDAVIEVLIAAASSTIDLLAGRTFAAVEEARRYRPALLDPELLLDADLVSVETLTNGDGQEIDEDDYELLPLNGYPKYGISLLRGGWRGPNPVEVDGTWGFGPEVPEDIKLACYQIVAAEYKRRFGDTEGSVGSITAGGVVIVPQSIPRTARDIIMARRKRVAG